MNSFVPKSMLSTASTPYREESRGGKTEKVSGEKGDGVIGKEKEGREVWRKEEMQTEQNKNKEEKIRQKVTNKGNQDGNKEGERLPIRQEWSWLATSYL